MFIFHGISRVESCLIPLGSSGKTSKSSRQNAKPHLTDCSPVNVWPRQKPGPPALSLLLAALSIYGLLTDIVGVFPDDVRLQQVIGQHEGTVLHGVK